MELALWLLGSILIMVFFPRLGLVARYISYRTTRAREQTEDALKLLLECENQGHPASHEFLAAGLEVSRPEIRRLVERMEAQGLIQPRGTGLYLTEEGKRWALHFVRAHRLWERYLADEARMPLVQVHAEAQRREHDFTQTQLDELDAALGHPVLDPHGDPIPTAQGTVHKVDAMPVTEWQVGEPARIAHLEDEPALAYQQIIAAGLQLGQTINVLERTPERIVLSDAEREYRLPTAVASNVHVTAITEAEPAKGNVVRLSELGHGLPAQVAKLDDGLQGLTRRRFLDLGLTPGAIIFPELRSLFDDPRAYRIRDTLIALRKDQAAQIWVIPTANGEK